MQPRRVQIGLLAVVLAIILYFSYPTKVTLLLSTDTNFRLLDPLIDRRWSIELTHFTSFPKCSDQKITYYVKSQYWMNYERRQRARQTWGKGKNLVFLCFSKEDSKVNSTKQTPPPDLNFQDILLSDSYPESADFLSVKIALGVYHASQCNSHAAFTDDDVHFFVDRFEKMVFENWELNSTVAVRGYFHHEEPPVRDKKSPWAKYLQTLQEYPYNKFPTYAHGAGYIASVLAVKEIVKTIPYTRVLRHVDDVYFGLLSRDAN